MKILSSKRRAAVGAALILLALFLIRPGASRLKSRLIYSISAAVGRSVDISSVHLRLLPRPGFDLKNLVVYDDPAFGAEPMLRASEVTASLRLMSLVRGRMEVSRLDLAEPSLNLANRGNGHWNVEGLLERATQSTLVPSGKASSNQRPAFPYIEGTSGRINFKNGTEKRPYALTNADFALWQESDNGWGMRLKAEPFRSDLNLTDIGLIQASGSWQRAETLRESPLQISVEWNHAQLGQLTKFVSGKDRGWRGTILLDVSAKGSLAKLQLTGTASVEDFRRYDITSGDPLRMAAFCDAEYSSLDHEFHGVMCNAPVGSGMLTLTGEVGLPSSGFYAVAMTAENIPAMALLGLAQRAKKNIPDDLAADGTIQAKLSMEKKAESNSPLRFDGNGEISDLHLNSSGLKAEFGPVTVPFVLAGGSTRNRARRLKLNAAELKIPEGPHVEFPALPLGSAHAAALRGWANRAGYDFNVLGDTDIARTLRLARMLGLPALSATVDGSSQLDLDIAGAWAANAGEFVGPQVTGTAKLRNVTIAPQKLAGAVELTSADMLMSPESVHVTRLNAKAAGATWSGSVELPRGCGTPDACDIEFVLSTKELALEDVNDWLHPNIKGRPWYRILESAAQGRPSLLASLHATGQLSADRLLVHGVEATHVAAKMTLQDGKAEFSALTGNLLDGTHQGNWTVNFAVKPAVCSGRGTLSRIALEKMAEAMDDGWVSGTADASYQLKGTCPTDFWESADGSLRLDVVDGVFPHVFVGNSADPLRAAHMTGQAKLHSGKIEFLDTTLNSARGIYQLSGTASLDRAMDLKLTRISNDAPKSGYTIGGTLAEPQVVALTPPEQARLKSLPTK